VIYFFMLVPNQLNSTPSTMRQCQCQDDSAETIVI
jgi:hypothetical protein